MAMNVMTTNFTMDGLHDDIACLERPMRIFGVPLFLAVKPVLSGHGVVNKMQHDFLCLSAPVQLGCRVCIRDDRAEELHRDVLLGHHAGDCLDLGVCGPDSGVHGSCTTSDSL